MTNLLIATGLLLGILVTKYSWRLTRYFWSLSNDSGDALSGVIGISLAAFGVALGIGIICLSLSFLVFGASVFLPS